MDRYVGPRLQGHRFQLQGRPQRRAAATVSVTHHLCSWLAGYLTISGDVCVSQVMTYIYEMYICIEIFICIYIDMYVYTSYHIPYSDSHQGLSIR